MAEETIGDRYIFVTDNEKHQSCIGVRGGLYDGVVYRYGEITVPEPPEYEINFEGDLPLKFEYDILDYNDLPEKVFGEAFQELIGDILVDILDEQLKKGTLEYVESDN